MAAQDACPGSPHVAPSALGRAQPARRACPATPAPRGLRARPPRRPRLPARVPLSAPLSPFASKPSGKRRGFESLSAH